LIFVNLLPKVKKMYSTLKNFYALYLVDHTLEKYDYSSEGATKAFQMLKSNLMGM